jgi:hypothetical protein
MAAHRVRALLMGGQACVFYGAAEFSRDTDLLILASPGCEARDTPCIRTAYGSRKVLAIACRSSSSCDIVPR